MKNITLIIFIILASFIYSPTTIAQGNSVVVIPTKEQKNSNSSIKELSLPPERVAPKPKSQITNESTNPEKQKNIWEKLKSRPEIFKLLGIAVIFIFLWGLARYIFTGKQFADSEYAVLETMYSDKNSYIEKRKYINSGEVFYFAEGFDGRDSTGKISLENYEKLKLKIEKKV
jgi:hypothetical protein